MSALTRYFCEPVYFPRSAWSVVGWWETRRPAYNLAVGAAGLTTLAIGSLVAGPPPLAFLRGVLAYGIAANLCFSLGPALDLLARRVGGPSWALVGPTLFRYGFAFSIGLTLLPIPAMLFFGLLHLLGVAT